MNDVKIVNLDKLMNAIFGGVPALAAKTRNQEGFPAPVSAIFNVKTEESVPVLDENGQPKYEQGENGSRRIVKETKKLDWPVLASKVFFSDGTWTVVKNSAEDSIELVEKELSDGSKVVTASDASKERALAYATIKRLFGRVDPSKKEIKGANLGRKIDEILARSVDKRVAEAESRISKRIAAAEKTAAETVKTAKKSSSKRPSKDEIKNLVENVVSSLAEAIKNGSLGLDLNKSQAGA